jgi:hypothetical protein
MRVVQFNRFSKVVSAFDDETNKVWNSIILMPESRSTPAGAGASLLSSESRRIAQCVATLEG